MSITLHHLHRSRCNALKGLYPFGLMVSNTRPLSVWLYLHRSRFNRRFQTRAIISPAPYITRFLLSLLFCHRWCQTRSIVGYRGLNLSEMDDIFWSINVSVPVLDCTCYVHYSFRSGQLICELIILIRVMRV